MVWILRTNFYTQLPLNKDDNNFEEQYNDIIYRETVKNLHDAGFKNSYFTSADMSMLDSRCGVSQYPQFYYKDLDMYQVLPHPYNGSFDVFPGEKLILKMNVRLGKSSRKNCLGMY